MSYILSFFTSTFAIFFNGLISYKVFLWTLNYKNIAYIGTSFICAIIIYRIEVKHQLVKVSKVKRVDL